MSRSTLLAALLVLAFPVVTTAQDSASPTPAFRIVDGSAMAILVEDAPKQAAWYREAFGLSTAKHLKADDGAYDIYVLSGGGLVVELIQVARAAPRPPDMSLGLFKAGIFVDSIDVAHAWLSARSGTVDAAPFTDEALQVRSFVLRDPEGNRLQLFARCGGPCPP